MGLQRYRSPGVGSEWHSSAIDAERLGKPSIWCCVLSTNLAALYGRFVTTEQKMKKPLGLVMGWHPGGITSGRIEGGQSRCHSSPTSAHFLSQTSLPRSQGLCWSEMFISDVSLLNLVLHDVQENEVTEIKKLTNRGELQNAYRWRINNELGDQIKKFSQKTSDR